MKSWRMKVDISGIDKLTHQLEPADEEVKNSCEYALKAMRRPFIAQIGKLACKRYNVDPEAINRRLAANVYASKKTLSIYISGRRLNMVSFNGTTPTAPPTIVRDLSKPKRHININGTFITAHPAKPYKIDVEIIKGQRKTLSVINSSFGGASPSFPFVMKTGASDASKMPFFIAKNNGKKNSGKNSVGGVTTLSIPQMISNENVAPQIEEVGAELFMKYFDSYINKLQVSKRI